jgi:hypothetical protein
MATAIREFSPIPAEQTHEIVLELINRAYFEWIRELGGIFGVYRREAGNDAYSDELESMSWRC